MGQNELSRYYFYVRNDSRTRSGSLEEGFGIRRSSLERSFTVTLTFTCHLPVEERCNVGKCIPEWDKMSYPDIMYGMTLGQESGIWRSLEEGFGIRRSSLELVFQSFKILEIEL
jgi:hypothetical protein